MAMEYTIGLMEESMKEIGNMENSINIFFNLNRHGMGHYYLPDGTMKTGLWEDGKRIKWVENN